MELSRFVHGGVKFFDSRAFSEECCSMGVTDDRLYFRNIRQVDKSTKLSIVRCVGIHFFSSLLMKFHSNNAINKPRMPLIGPNTCTSCSYHTAEAIVLLPRLTLLFLKFGRPPPFTERRTGAGRLLRTTGLFGSPVLTESGGKTAITVA